MSRRPTLSRQKGVSLKKLQASDTTEEDADTPAFLLQHRAKAFEEAFSASSASGGDTSKDSSDDKYLRLGGASQLDTTWQQKKEALKIDTAGVVLGGNLLQVWGGPPIKEEEDEGDDAVDAGSETQETEEEAEESRPKFRGTRSWRARSNRSKEEDHFSSRSLRKRGKRGASSSAASSPSSASKTGSLSRTLSRLSGSKLLAQLAAGEGTAATGQGGASAASSSEELLAPSPMLTLKRGNSFIEKLEAMSSRRRGSPLASYATAPAPFLRSALTRLLQLGGWKEGALKGSDAVSDYTEDEAALLKVEEPHVVWAMVLSWLRELPSALLPPEVCHCINEAVLLPEGNVKLSCMSSLLSLLPTAGCKTIVFLLQQLSKHGGAVLEDISGELTEVLSRGLVRKDSPMLAYITDTHNWPAIRLQVQASPGKKPVDQALDKLMDRYYESVEPSYLDMMMHCWEYVCDDITFLGHFTTTYFDNLEIEGPGAAALRTRALGMLFHWLEFCSQAPTAERFSPQLFRALRTFQTALDADKEKDSRALEYLLYLKTVEPAQVSRKPLSVTPPPPVVPEDFALNMDYGIEEVCLAFTASTQRLFSQIATSEFLLKHWESPESAPCFTALVHTFNQWQLWGMQLIMGPDDMAERLVFLRYIIELATLLVAQHSYHAGYALFAAVNHSSVTRMRALWGLLGSPYDEDFAEMEKLFDPRGNYANYQARLAQVLPTRTAVLPYMGFYSKFLFVTEDAVKQTKGDAPLGKMRILYMLVQQLQSMQYLKFDVEMAPISLVAFYCTLEMEVTEEEIYQRSIQHEPIAGGVAVDTQRTAKRAAKIHKNIERQRKESAEANLLSLQKFQEQRLAEELARGDELVVVINPLGPRGPGVEAAAAGMGNPLQKGTRAAAAAALTSPRDVPLFDFT